MRTHVSHEPKVARYLRYVELGLAVVKLLMRGADLAQKLVRMMQ